MPLDIIFYEGDVGNEMFFIKNGTVLIINKNKQITRLNSTYFGEKSLLFKTRRLTNAKAESFLTLMILEREHLTLL